jgi:hypothetical protein
MRREARKKRLTTRPGRLRPVPPPKKGLKLVGIRLRPDQVRELRREARRRAEERDSGKPDSSELVREALDVWLAAKRSK